MGIYPYEVEFKTVKSGGKAKILAVLPNKKFDKFKPSILGLGRINQPSEKIEAIAAVFDLSGFTKFCNQPDPHLSIPKYLSRFLDWLFEEIRMNITNDKKKYKNGKVLYADLPFLAKFLGDGVLFLWNTKNMSEVAICNIPLMLREICLDYVNEFRPEVKKKAVNAPKKLRCGVARGMVCSVGNRRDFVGPCINIASRLQKLSELTFCCSCRGFDFDRYIHKKMLSLFMTKRVSLRGIGKNELVWIPQDEFDTLPKAEKDLFRNP